MNFRASAGSVLPRETVCGPLFKWKEECKYGLQREWVEGSQTAVLREAVGLGSGAGRAREKGPSQTAAACGTGLVGRGRGDVSVTVSACTTRRNASDGALRPE